MKKFLVTLLMGAFLFASMAAVVGCGDSSSPVKKEEKKEEKKDK